jgi:hypothetical protein
MEKNMRQFLISSMLLLAATTAVQPAYAEGTEKIEEVLVEKWQFFKTGDTNRDGFLSEKEFMDHELYRSIGWKTAPKTFVFWMIDDNKDSKVSLQEWFNNELGQFQMGDKNHDGFIDEKEYEWMVNLQEKLFKDLGYGN